MRDRVVTLIAAASLFAGHPSIPAAAEPWDHRANIADSVAQFDRTYREGGISGVSMFLEGCYAGAKESGASSKVEYCVAMDYAAAWIDEGYARHFQKLEPDKQLSELRYPYFLPEAQRQRMIVAFEGEGLPAERRDVVLQNIRAAAISDLMRQIEAQKKQPAEPGSPGS